MNREIKFRAWDGGQMHPRVGVRQDGGWFDEGGFPSQGAVVLMQFTGLKDKNGKEIYEGDVVRTSEYDRPHQVAFGGGKFYLAADMTDDSLTTPLWIEIIGNIYENPDLLK